MKSINIKQCLKVIELHKDRKSSNELHIGLMVKKYTPEHMKHYCDAPILFSRSKYDEGTVTIEKPMDDDWLSQQKQSGSHLTTYCTMVCVPEGMVTEIIL